MLFVRHNSLLPPYDDYNRLTMAELDALAEGAVSPSAAALPDSLPDIRDALQDADVIACSSIMRTQQTCRALLAHFGVDKTFAIDANLDEIRFKPSCLAATGSGSALERTRKNLFPAILAGSPFAETQDRIGGRLFAVEKSYAGRRAVLFSHGFFIRLTQSWQRHGQNLQKALAHADDFPSVGYLESRDI